MPAHDWTITVGTRPTRSTVRAQCARCSASATIRVVFATAAALEWAPSWTGTLDKHEITPRRADGLVRHIGVAHAYNALKQRLATTPDSETFMAPVVFCATADAAHETAMDLGALGFTVPAAVWEWNTSTELLPTECEPARQAALV